MTDLFDTDTPTVRVRTREDLVAALPSMLGFVPTHSLVAITLHARDGRSRVGGMARVDVPDCGDDAGEYADAVVAQLAPAAPSSVQLVVITEAGHHDTDGGPRPPRSGVVDMFRAGFAAVGIESPAPLWAARIAAGAPWRCYDECGCAGVLPDPGASPAAAAHAAVTGRVVYRSRAEAEAALAPDPDAESAHRRELISDAHWDALSERTGAAAAACTGVDAVRAAVEHVGRSAPLGERDLAQVAVALGDPAVRDVCLGFAVGYDPQVDPEHATRLWWQLTRALPAPEVAEAATLLAFATLRRGGGVTLSVALERAMRADPGHRLSRLLDRAVSSGVDAGTIEAMVLEAAGITEARHRER